MMAIFFPSSAAAHLASGALVLVRVGTTRVTIGLLFSVILGLIAPQTINGMLARLNTGIVAKATPLFQCPVAATTSGSLVSFKAAATPVCGLAASSRITGSILNGKPACVALVTGTWET